MDMRISKLLRESKSKDGISLYHHLCSVYGEYFYESKNGYNMSIY